MSPQKITKDVRSEINQLINAELKKMRAKLWKKHLKNPPKVDKVDVDENETIIPTEMFDDKEFYSSSKSLMNCTIQIYRIISDDDEKSKRTIVLQKDDKNYAFMCFPWTATNISKSLYNKIISSTAPDNAYGITNFLNDSNLVFKCAENIMNNNKKLKDSYGSIVMAYMAGISVLNQETAQEIKQDLVAEKREIELSKIFDDIVNEQNNSDGILLNNNYLEYTLNPNANALKSLFKYEFDCEYVKNNFHPNSCMLTAVITHFHDYMFGRMKSATVKRWPKALTYERLCELCGLEYKKSDISCSIAQIMPFFEKFKFGLYVFNKEMQLIYRYDTGKHEKTMYIVKHNQHIYLLNKNINSLKHKAFLQEEITLEYEPTYDDVEYTYNIPKDDEKTISTIHYVDDQDQVQAITEILKSAEKDSKKNKDEDEDDEVEEKHNHIIFVFDINIIASYFIENDIDVCMFGNEHEITQITFKVNKTRFNIKRVMIGDTRSNKALTKEESEKYLKVTAEFEKKMLKHELLSNFLSETLDIFGMYKITPIVCKLSSYIPSFKSEVNGLDLNRAYPSLLMNKVNAVPVFNWYNTFEVYDNEPINDYYYYIVECDTFELSQDEAIILPNKYCRVFGFMLKNIERLSKVFADSERYKILYVLKYDRIEAVDFKNEFEFLGKQDLECMHKDIANKTIGKYGIKNLSKFSEKTHVFKNLTDATVYANLTNCNVVKVNSTTYCVCEKYNEKRLSNGFHVISELIYSFQRERLYMDVSLMRENKIVPLGIRSDCIYYYATDFGKMNQVFPHDKKMGNYKCERDKTVCGDVLKCEENNLIEIKNYDNQKKRSFKTECEWKENNKYIHAFNKYVKETNNVLVLADLPGSGKSHMVASMKNRKMLFVTRCRVLCNEITAKFEKDAITCNQLLGLSVAGIQKAKGYDISEYDTIVFDEIYTFGADMLYRIRKLMMNNSDKTFIATGDEKQIIAIGSTIEKTKKIINILFQNVVVLKICKRQDMSEEELSDLSEFKSKLFAKRGCAHHMALLKEYSEKLGWRIIDDKMSNISDKCVAFYNYTCGKVNNYLEKKLDRPMWTVGNRVLTNGCFKVKGHNFNSNIECIVTKVTSTSFTVEYNEEEITFTNSHKKNFKNSYCLTIDACQGITIDKPYTIMNVGSQFVNNNYLWTMLTRCSQFSDISIVQHGKEEICQYNKGYMSVYLRNKIYDYKTQDKIAGRTVDEKTFVTAEWFLNKMSDQLMKCHHCGCHFSILDNKSNFSLDRINNNLAHTMNNCVVACNSCNCKRCKA